MLANVESFLAVHAVGLLSSGLVVSLIAHVLPTLLDKFLQREFSRISSIDDPDLKAAAVSLIRFIDKEFPSGGSVEAAINLVKRFPELAPVQGALTNLLVALAGVVKKDLDQASNKT